MNKKLLSAVLSVALTISFNSVVLADPTKEQLEQQQKDLQNSINNNTSSMKQMQDQQEQAEHGVELLDNQIEDLMRQIDSTKKQIDSTTKDISQVQKEIKKAEDDMKSEQTMFNNRIRAMYMNGMDGYMSVLFESDGLEDLLTKIDTVKTLRDYDKKILDDLKAKKDDISKKKDVLEAKNTSLQALMEQNKQKKDKLDVARSTQTKLIADLKAKEKMYASKIDQDKKTEADVTKKLQQLAAAAKPPSRGGIVTGNEVIEFAAKYLGKPYSWGATGPNSFDCSGFTQFVYRNFGITIGRTTYDQINDGVAVSRDNLQPGDLVFFGTWSNPHHVGIYAGNNCYIHAPQTGDVVKVSVMDRSDYVTARRVK